ncbi:MAG: hypothetical protein HY513_00580 [Candidatus Aenigmarchaeota archaeon]|nr:hypothetical protein [Candidatus Aenigmarchaeota archaeon]
MPQETQGLIMQELVRRSNEDTRRLRTIEQRLDGMEARLVALEDTMLDKTKKMNLKAAELEASLRLVSDEMLMVKTNMERITRQLPTFARKQDLKEIEHMFELLNPIRQEFITKDQLDEELKQRDEVIR